MNRRKGILFYKIRDNNRIYLCIRIVQIVCVVLGLGKTMEKPKNGVYPQGYGTDNMVARRRERIYRDI